MKTITSTEYAYNTETGTTTQTRIIPLFEFHELGDDAQARIIGEYAEERANDPYFSQWFNDSYERDIWECVRDLEKSIHSARVSWQYNRWYSCDFDCEYKIKDIDWLEPDTDEPADDTGYYASMDLCDAWNAHTRKLNALATMYGQLCDEVEKYPFDEWEYYSRPENRVFGEKLDEIRESVHDRWINELERACDDVRDAIEILLRGEWDYYTSEECARDEFEANETGEEYRTRDNAGRVYYHDSRKWYTSEGEFYEQSSIDHACVSIVKAG